MEGDVFLLLGTNLGDKVANLKEARKRISELGEFGRWTSIYVTDAWGNKLQPDFMNQAMYINTRLSPEQLLKAVLGVETEMGRVRSEKWGPRIIDIDILFYGESVIKSESLTIPHPEIQNRRFALAPMYDLAPDFIHPVLKKTIKELLRECTDQLTVTRWPDQP